MDKVEAKLVLANFSLGNPPVGDARYDEALRLAEADPELMDWWRRSKEHDAAIQGRLKEFEPPEDLRSALAASLEQVSKRQVIRRKIVKYLALAASVAVTSLLIFNFSSDQSADDQEAFAERAFNYAFNGPDLQYFEKDTKKLAEWLEEQGFELPDRLPPKFLAQEGIGCRPLDWSENRVAIICVNADVAYHLFIAKGEDFEALDLSSGFAYEEQRAGWTVGKWKSQGRLFVLTAKASQANLESMLAGFVP